MKFTRRPWGWMITLFHFKKFWLKFLWVKGRTSRQYHLKRTEYHLGIQIVEPTERHRLQHGVYIEFATGKPSEEDIIRISDDYGRK